jgi:predicted nuclease of predicted toxin-antitoxin system
MAMLKFYFDEMMPRPAMEQLRLKGIDIVLANDEGMTSKSDPDHLAYATGQNRVMVTHDRPFAGKMAKAADVEHAGLVCINSTFQGNVGAIVRIVTELAEAFSAEEMRGRVLWR